MSVSEKNSYIIFGIPKIPRRYGAIVMSLLLSIFMTSIVSLISTFRTIGADPQFLRIWLGAWAISWIIAFPTLLLVLPVVRKSTAALVRGD